MNRIPSNPFHLRVDLRVEVELRIAFLHESVQLIVGDLVAFLETAVIWEVFLDCVVGQMHGP